MVLYLGLRFQQRLKLFLVMIESKKIRKDKNMNSNCPKLCRENNAKILTNRGPAPLETPLPTPMSDYFVHFCTLLGARYSEDFLLHTNLLRHKLLNSLDTYTRLSLYHHEEAPLNELDHHADKLLSRIRPASNCNTATAESTTSTIAGNQGLGTKCHSPIFLLATADERLIQTFSYG